MMSEYKLYTCLQWFWILEIYESNWYGQRVGQTRVFRSDFDRSWAYLSPQPGIWRNGINVLRRWPRCALIGQQHRNWGKSHGSLNGIGRFRPCGYIFRCRWKLSKRFRIGGDRLKKIFLAASMIFYRSIFPSVMPFWDDLQTQCSFA